MTNPSKNVARCAFFAALLCVCGWIAIPLPGIAVTMQTFGVFLTLELLGGKWGSAACLVYLLLGAAGLPVFSGFQGGIGVLLGATGGYLWGFLAAGMIYWIAGSRLPRQAIMILGLLSCYVCGTLWYAFVWLDGTAALPAVLAQCVLPYVLPDGLKLYLAAKLSKQLRRHLRN